MELAFRAASGESSYLCPYWIWLDAKNWLRKAPDAGKDWKQKKGTAEGGMVGWCHWLDGHESEQFLGAAEGQGSLICCSPRGLKESDTNRSVQQFNWTELGVTQVPPGGECSSLSQDGFQCKAFWEVSRTYHGLASPPSFRPLLNSSGFWWQQHVPHWDLLLWDGSCELLWSCLTKVNGSSQWFPRA